MDIDLLFISIFVNEHLYTGINEVDNGLAKSRIGPRQELEKHSTLSCMKKSLKWRLGKGMNPIRWGRQGESKVKQTNKQTIKRCFPRRVQSGTSPTGKTSIRKELKNHHLKFVAIVQSLSHVLLYDLMYCNTSGSSVLHYCPEFAQINVH